MTMAGRKKSGDTIAALLGAPGLAPVRDEPAPAATVPAEEQAGTKSADVTPELRTGEQVYEATATPVRPDHLRAVVPAEDVDEELDDTNPEDFTFEATAPLVRPRKRKSMDYQTVRLFRSTWQPLRQAWLMNRKVDVLISFTEFASVVVQRGLEAMKAEAEARTRAGE